MDIYEALKRDHERVKTLLQQLVDATEHNESTKRILDDIEDELIPHSRAEEAVFYNTLREEGHWQKTKAADSFREHGQAETLLRTLKGMEKINVEWTASAKQLQESLLHHITEEETETFAQAQQAFTNEEAKQLGEAFEKAKAESRQQGSLKNSVEFIANMMPKRFADSIRQSLHNAS